MTKTNFRVNRGFLTRGPAMAMDSLHRRDDEPDEFDDEHPDIEIHNHIPEDYGALASEEMTPGDPGRRHVDDRRHRQRDDEEEVGEVAARFPADFHAQVEGDELVVYSRPPLSQRTDIYDFKIEDRGRRPADRHRLADTRDAWRARPPRTTAALNRFMADYYPRRKATAAR
jgi:hypothetical protein